MKKTIVFVAAIACLGAVQASEAKADCAGTGIMGDARPVKTVTVKLQDRLKVAQIVNPNQHVTNGYYRGNGTYVQPYRATNPDGNPNNNFDSQINGNPNPYASFYKGR